MPATIAHLTMHPDREFHPVTEEGRRAQAECMAERDRIEAQIGRPLAVTVWPLTPETRRLIAATVKGWIQKYGPDTVESVYEQAREEAEGSR